MRVGHTGSGVFLFGLTVLLTEGDAAEKRRGGSRGGGGAEATEKRGSGGVGEKGSAGKEPSQHSVAVFGSRGGLLLVWY